LVFFAVLGRPEAGFAFEGPQGWQHLCERSTELCNTRPQTTAPHINAREIDLLNAINTSVNEAIRPRLEPAGVDVWQISPRFGDCDDYAVTKKWRLLQAGWPRDRLRFATVLTESHELHVVLTVDAAQGRLVLDNRFTQVTTLDHLEALGYKVLAIEGDGPRGTWQATRYAGVAALFLAASGATR
jgi:predicted transglutaminase-like cysteine proteinase